MLAVQDAAEADRKHVPQQLCPAMIGHSAVACAGR
jgi:hypothetical protein